ncbi:hypothetical protein [Catenulispora pinisilvae]|uniref:hypothetical protein n=1 Tax=Catenulispora pinisilvae TaxID=2705253 RepID=UPI001890DEBE|nr:hypothetical protein [Catenulispora pinisilvae]
MKNTEELSGETARDLLGMMFDEGGVSVPPDDLAPAAMAGYRRYRRWRNGVIGAGASVALVGVASVALAVAGGGSGGSGTTPGSWLTTNNTAPPGQHSSAPSQGSTSAVGSSGGRVEDCVTNFVPETGYNLAKAQADCRRAEALWQAVFPGSTISGDLDPGWAQITKGFATRVGTQNASAPSLYGRPQPQVIDDWAAARKEKANTGSQSWSGFDIQTAQGLVVVSASLVAEGPHVSCRGATPCESVPFGGSLVAEVSGPGGLPGYQVIVRSKDGHTYLMTFGSHYNPRYVDIPCSAPGGQCHADLTDGAIRPGETPDSAAGIGTPVVTHAMLMDILQRPAFAALAQSFFAEGLGQPSGA